MPEFERDRGALPTHETSPRETVILVRSLLVDWKVLEHLRAKAVVEDRPEFANANCCKPDGGTCCVNARPLAPDAGHVARQ